MSARILVVDNYDSFVFNLVQYLYQLGAECEVVRNDAVELGHAQDGFDGVLLSPAPAPPKRRASAWTWCATARTPASRSSASAWACSPWRWPSAASSGGPRAAARQDLLVNHGGEGVFRDLPTPFTATRYHSLAVERDTVPAELRITAWTGGDGPESGIAMGLRHRELPVEGVQFHPESVLTEWGHRMLANWLAECGDGGAVERSVGLAPVVGKAAA